MSLPFSNRKITPVIFALLIIFYLTNAVSQSRAQANCPLKILGDANCDGQFNLIDFEIWRREFTGLATTKNADFSLDSNVNLIDFEIWRRSFISPPPTGTTASRTPTPVVVTNPAQPTNTPFPTNPPPSGLRAFPQAEGFGANSVGGRSGQVIHITNLNNSGSGSLRSCIEATGKRTCIFDLSGTINLAGNKLTIANPYITIAGQTAPSPGIIIRSGTIQITTHDIIMRHLRLRYGDQPCKADDALQFHNSSSFNIIADHLSVSWGVDENINTYQNPHDVTLSNSIISEALSHSCHSEGEHSKGILLQDPTTRFSVIDNLFIHNFDRNPFVKNAVSAEVINNVFYNFGKSYSVRFGSLDSSGDITAAIVGNVIISGSNTPGGSVAASEINTSSSSRWFINDNHVEGVSAGIGSRNATSAPIKSNFLTVDPSSSVENFLKANAGARPTDRDQIDTQMILELSQRSGNIVDSQNQSCWSGGCGWPNLAVNTRQSNYDTDYDGMADSWETQNFGNTSRGSSSNSGSDFDADGYTDLEEFLNGTDPKVSN